MRPAAIAILWIFTAIASFDGFYFHLYRYRLHRRPASRFEHRLHTVNALLFPPSIALLFLAQASGAWLWLALALHFAIAAIEVVDVWIEPASRAELGGLTPAESVLHFAMSGLRWAYVALAFAAIGLAPWQQPTALEWRIPASLADASVLALVLTGVPVALLHVVLAVTGAARPRVAAA